MKAKLRVTQTSSAIGAAAAACARRSRASACAARALEVVVDEHAVVPRRGQEGDPPRHGRRSRSVEHDSMADTLSKLAKPAGRHARQDARRSRRRLRPRQDRRPRPEGPVRPHARLQAALRRRPDADPAPPAEARLHEPVPGDRSPRSTSASSSVFAAGAKVDETALREPRPRPGPLRPHQDPRRRRAHQDAHRHGARVLEVGRGRRSRRRAARPSLVRPAGRSPAPSRADRRPWPPSPASRTSARSPSSGGASSSRS